MSPTNMTKNTRDSMIRVLFSEEQLESIIGSALDEDAQVDVARDIIKATRRASDEKVMDWFRSEYWGETTSAALANIILAQNPSSRAYKQVVGRLDRVWRQDIMDARTKPISHLLKNKKELDKCGTDAEKAQYAWALLASERFAAVGLAPYTAPNINVKAIPREAMMIANEALFAEVIKEKESHNAAETGWEKARTALEKRIKGGQERYRQLEKKYAAVESARTRIQPAPPIPKPVPDKKDRLSRRIAQLEREEVKYKDRIGVLEKKNRALEQTLSERRKENGVEENGNGNYWPDEYPHLIALAEEGYNPIVVAAIVKGGYNLGTRVGMAYAQTPKVIEQAIGKVPQALVNEVEPTLDRMVRVGAIDYRHDKGKDETTSIIANLDEAAKESPALVKYIRFVQEKARDMRHT
jgi:hypothetical protein